MDVFSTLLSVWRKVQECRLQVEYNKRNSQVKKMVKRCSALAFLPLDRVDNAWKLIFDGAPDHPGVRRFLDYMVETWIDDIFAIFPPKIWGYHGNYGQRTTNSLEGLHRVEIMSLVKLIPVFMNLQL